MAMAMSNAWWRWRENLRDREGIGSVFAVNGTDDALTPIRNAGFEAIAIEKARDAETLDELVKARRPDLLICDLRDGFERRAA